MCGKAAKQMLDVASITSSVDARAKAGQRLQMSVGLGFRLVVSTTLVLTLAF